MISETEIVMKSVSNIELDFLAKSVSDSNIHKHIIGNIYTHINTLRYLTSLYVKKDMSVTDYMIGFALINNLNTPTDILEMLCDCEDKALLMGIANHINVTEKLLSRLMKAKSTELNIEIAKSLNVTAHILDWLSLEKDIYVKIAVAENPKTSTKVLSRMCLEITENTFAIVLLQIAIARHLNTSAETLGILSGSPMYTVRKRVVLNPNMSKDTLHGMGSDTEVTIQREVAKHANVDNKTLGLLVSSDDVETLVNIARNEITSEKIIQQLVAKHIFVVSTNIIARNNVSVNTLELITNDEKSSPLLINRANNRIEKVLIKNNKFYGKSRTNSIN